MFEIINVLLLLVVLFTIIGICGWIARGLTRRRADQLVWVSRARITSALLTAPFLIFLAYSASYPDDFFFLAHFTEVTARPAPPSAKVVKKKATTPDLQGNFCSYSTIALSARDYADLLAEIEKDARLEFIPQTSTSTEKHFNRHNPARPRWTLGIVFLDDAASIDINFCTY